MSLTTFGDGIVISCIHDSQPISWEIRNLGVSGSVQWDCLLPSVRLYLTMIRPQKLTVPNRVACLIPEAESYRNGLISVAEVLQVSYLHELERYLDWLAQEGDAVIIQGEAKPWTTVKLIRAKLKDKLKDKLKRTSKEESLVDKVDDDVNKGIYLWTTREEMSMVVNAICLTYVSMAALRTEELIEADSLSNELDHQWKSTTNLLKSLLSIVRYGQQTLGSSTLFDFLTCIVNINLQLGIIIKTGWTNRISFGSLDDIDGGKLMSKNNGTLTKVAIYCLGETNRALMSTDNSIGIKLNELWVIGVSTWHSYLVIMRKYIMGYMALFYSIDKYQQDKLGEAIGLVNFGIVTLQGHKTSDDIGTGKRAREWLKNHRQESLLRNMQSTAELNYSKSDFSKLDHMTQDLTYLFDMLVRLRVKYTKENETLKFDKVLDWKEVGQDTKWPQGIAIPVGAIEEYVLISQRNEAVAGKRGSERTPYY